MNYAGHVLALFAFTLAVGTGCSSNGKTAGDNAAGDTKSANTGATGCCTPTENPTLCSTHWAVSGGTPPDQFTRTWAYLCEPTTPTAPTSCGAASPAAAVGSTFPAGTCCLYFQDTDPDGVAGAVQTFQCANHCLDSVSGVCRIIPDPT